jgi:hypothetical protein
MRTIRPRLAVGALLLLSSGCASVPSVYTERELQARCEVTGGRWHEGTAREGFCEYQSPGML